MGERYHPDGGRRSEQNDEQNDMEQGHTIEHTERGVCVSVRSKRGSGTRDQDRVTVTSHYPSEHAALQNVDTLQTILADHLSEARQRDDPRTEAIDDDE